jgi:methylenetetrahydrofolate dehydrogenase (NADP+)/methenyltetrahydrofolate cyclohydrolase
VVLVGGDELATGYLERKRRVAEELGLRALMSPLPAATPTSELVAKLAALGADETVHGILLQYPIPETIDAQRAYEAIPPAKDVDCVTAANLGKMILGHTEFLPCAVEGVRRLLLEYGATIPGKHAVVLGDNTTLVRPLAHLFLSAGATVTLAPTDAANLPALIG